jgi:hypothetical protein
MTRIMAWRCAGAALRFGRRHGPVWQSGGTNRRTLRSLRALNSVPFDIMSHSARPRGDCGGSAANCTQVQVQAKHLSGARGTSHFNRRRWSAARTQPSAGGAASSPSPSHLRIHGGTVPSVMPCPRRPRRGRRPGQEGGRQGASRGIARSRKLKGTRKTRAAFAR